MKYSISYIQNNIKQENAKYLYFWGHQPSKDGKITKSCFSQWWSCTFEIDGITYYSAEQYMMAEKAKLFGDHHVREKILQTKHPKEAKNLGRTVSGFQEEIWIKHRCDIVKRGNVAKFSQNNDLKDFLLQTKDAILVEASPNDNIWGVGLAANDPKIKNPNQWQGLNLLGFLLMEIRDEWKVSNNIHSIY